MCRRGARGHKRGGFAPVHAATALHTTTVGAIASGNGGDAWRGESLRFHGAGIRDRSGRSGGDCLRRPLLVIS